MAKSEIVDQLVILAEAFGLSFNDARMDIYVTSLSDLPIKKIRAGIAHLIKTRTFAGNLPSVAEIREAVEDKIPIESQVAIAWDKFRYALANHCPYDSVKFDDPIISHIISVWGGWTSMGDWDESQTYYRRREFAKLYEAYAKSGNLPAVPDHHVGLTEYENTRTGYVEFIPTPVLITWNSDQGKIMALPYKQAVQRVKHLTATGQALRRTVLNDLLPYHCPTLHADFYKSPCDRQIKEAKETRAQFPNAMFMFLERCLECGGKALVKRGDPLDLQEAAHKKGHQEDSHPTLLKKQPGEKPVGSTLPKTAGKAENDEILLESILRVIDDFAVDGKIPNRMDLSECLDIKPYKIDLLIKELRARGEIEKGESYE